MPPAPIPHTQRPRSHLTVAVRRSPQGFMLWMNSYLSPSGIKVSSLEDLRDGVALVTLLQVMSDGDFKFPRMKAKPGNKFECIANLDAVFRYLQSKSVRLVRTRPTATLKSQNRSHRGTCILTSERRHAPVRTQVGIGVENIYESDFTLVLGFIYTLIVKYEIERYGADVKDLLRWLKRQVAGFDTAMAMDLRNFTACLADGMCARCPTSTTPAATKCH